jgi:hypothetical protein
VGSRGPGAPRYQGGSFGPRWWRLERSAREVGGGWSSIRAMVSGPRAPRAVDLGEQQPPGKAAEAIWGRDAESARLRWRLFGASAVEGLSGLSGALARGKAGVARG